jgi:hypothetical protein
VDNRDAWVIDIPGHGVTQATRMSEIEMIARDYLECLHGSPGGGFEIEVSVEIPREVDEPSWPGSVR